MLLVHVQQRKVPKFFYLPDIASDVVNGAVRVQRKLRRETSARYFNESPSPKREDAGYFADLIYNFTVAKLKSYEIRSC